MTQDSRTPDQVRVGDVWRVFIPMCEPESKQEPRDMEILAVHHHSTQGDFAWCSLGGWPFTERLDNWRSKWTLLRRTT